MTRQPTPDLLAEPETNGADIVAASFGPPVTAPDLAYNYSLLDPETRIVVQQRTSEILTLKRRAEQDVIEIGVRLVEVKGKLAHGEFSGWLRTEFSWSQDVANRFMAVAQTFGQNTRIAYFASYSALAMLSAPSVPAEAREEAEKLAEAGERVTVPIARQIIEQHRPPAPPALPAPTGPAPAALAAVSTWLSKHVSTGQRTYALRNYKTPPWSNTLRQHTAGIAPEQVRAAVSFIIANPDAVRQAALVEPVPVSRPAPAPARAARPASGEAPPRPPAAPRFVTLDATEADGLANVLEGQCVDAVSVDGAGRMLLDLRSGFAVQIAAVTEDGRPALAWRIVS